MRALASEIASRVWGGALLNAATKTDKVGSLTGDTHKVDRPIPEYDLDEGAHRHRPHVVVELDPVP